MIKKINILHCGEQVKEMGLLFLAGLLIVQEVSGETESGCKDRSRGCFCRDLCLYAEAGILG